MKFKTCTGITWSDLELMGLVEDEDTRVYLEKYKKHLGLHPFHLTNLNAALNEILSSNLNFYDADLKGFLLAYKSLKLLTPFGEIFYDTCFIHVDIEADFYIFRPEVGCILKGIVNKKGLDHIGILVHKAFNVSIPKPDNEEDWPGENVQMGQEIKCTITLLDYTSKLPFIRGALNPNEYLQGCKLMDSSINKKKKFVNDNVDINAKNSIKGVNKEKKKSKQIFFATDSENTSDEDVPHIKKESIEEKKSKKKVEQEKSIDYNEVQIKAQKSSKKNTGRESKPKLTDMESAEDAYINNVITNGNEGAVVKKEKSSASSRKSGTKNMAHSSQSSIDEDHNDNDSEICLSQKRLRKKCPVDSTNVINKTEVEHQSPQKGVEDPLEKSTLDSKPKIKKRSLKRRLSEDTDFSASEFTTEKYQSLNASNKKSAKESKTPFIKTEETAVYIKSESSNDIHDSNVDSVKKSPKKKRKRHSQIVTGDTSEDETDTNTGKSPVKKGLAFLNSVIKRDSINGNYENNHDKSPETANIKNNVSVANLNVSNSNYDIEADSENSTPQKKRKKHSKTPFIDTSKIKIEPDFGDGVIKVEKIDDGYNDNTIEDNQPINEKLSSFGKVENNDDSDIDNVKLSKKRTSKKDGSVEARTVKPTASDSSDFNYSDANVGTSGKKKKHKVLNKLPKVKVESEYEFDTKNIRIKTERNSEIEEA